VKRRSRARASERANLLLERLGHLVERGGPGAELVVGLDRKPSLEQALRESVRGRARLSYRPEHPPGDERSGGRGEEDYDAPSRQQNRPELREVVAQGFLGEEEVELCLRRWWPTTGDEVRSAGDPHSLEPEVAVSYEAPQPGGDLRPSEARPELLFADQCNRLETRSPGVERTEVGDVLRRGRSPEDDSRQHEVRARVRERAVDGVAEARAADREVRTERERPGRDRGDEGEGDCESPPQPSRGYDTLHRPRSSR